LVRSGRIELWLEMRLPDESARSAILEQHIAAAPKPLNEARVEQIVQATEGFTGADLKRTLEDGKAFYAFDLVAGREFKPATDYYVAAAETVRSNKEKYAEAEARANASRPSRPVWFNPFSHHDFSAGVDED
jgi:ATP-dependent 26S proteasome regulatory subunit